MKRIIYILSITIIMGILSCDKYPELNESVQGYSQLNFSFFATDWNSISQEYVFLLDSDTIRSTNTLVMRGADVKLAVFKIGEEEPTIIQNIKMSESRTLQFIKLGGQPLSLFETDKYTTIKVNIIFASGEDISLYKVLFNNIELSINSQVINYIPIDKLTGTLEIQKEGNVEESRNVTFEPDGTLSYMQLKLDEGIKYLSLDGGEQGEPEQGQTWVRFFYLEDIVDAPELELTLYYRLKDRTFDPIETIVLSANELSKYVLFDFTKESNDVARSYIVYDLKIPTEEEFLVIKGDGSDITGRIKTATAQLRKSTSGKYQLRLPIKEQWPR